MLRSHRSPILLASTAALVAAWLTAPTAARAQQPDEPAPAADQEPAPEQPDSAPPPTQVLLIPLGAPLGTTLPAPWTDAPARLNQALDQVVEQIGAQPVAAAVGKSDITAITGCPAESDECFREVASTIEVDEILFGTVEPTADGAGVEISLTLIRRDGDLSRRRIALTARDPEAAAVEFRPQARAFLLGEPPPSGKVDLTVSEHAATPAGPAGPARFALGRVKPYSWAIAGGGVLMIGVSAILFAKASDKQDEVDSARVDTGADLARLVELEDQGKRLTTWGNVLLIGGSVAAVAGIALVVKQGLTRPAETAPAPPPPPTVTLTPLPGQQGVAVTVLGQF